ncbi:hypothetical protein CEXT_526501 [Caerostris extrusa]|uniref:Uncharacterized protein n=1 Tax=Caerostris extrusa TaxID=172846 RepID=A0AAV4Q0P5_CAEEX|nr:hypothetical protein CEXT_526501 [Caerostris extrusa]
MNTFEWYEEEEDEKHPHASHRIQLLLPLPGCYLIPACWKRSLECRRRSCEEGGALNRGSPLLDNKLALICKWK